MMRFMNRVISALLSASVLLASPDIGSYQAAAQTIQASEAGGSGGNGSVQRSTVLSIPHFSSDELSRVGGLAPSPMIREIDRALYAPELHEPPVKNPSLPRLPAIPISRGSDYTPGVALRTLQNSARGPVTSDSGQIYFDAGSAAPSFHHLKAFSISRYARAIRQYFGTREDDSLVLGSSTGGKLSQQSGQLNSFNPDPRPTALDRPIRGDRGGSGADGGSGGRFDANGAVKSFIAGLMILQMGVEAFLATLSTSMQKRFHDATASLYLEVGSAVSGIFGRGIAGMFIQRYGLKNTYAGILCARAALIGAMLALMPHVSLPWIVAIYSVHGFLFGISITAETSIGPGIVGRDAPRLNHFWILRQIFLQLVGIVGPIAAGVAVAHLGFTYVPWAFPIALFASSLFFYKKLRLAPEVEKNFTRFVKAGFSMDEAGRRTAVAPTIHRASPMHYMDLPASHYVGLQSVPHESAMPAFSSTPAPAPEPAPKTGFGRILKQIPAKLKEGAVLVWRDRLLRTALIAYAVYFSITPMLYLMAPLFSLRLLTSPEIATSAAGWIVGLYSAGSVAGAIMMNRRQKSMDTEERLNRSLVKWMRWGALSFGLLAVFAFPASPFGVWIHLPLALRWAQYVTIQAIAVIPLGIFQGNATAKLMPLFLSKAPAKKIAEVTGFQGIVSLAAITVLKFAFKYLFNHWAGFIPFVYFSYFLVPVVAGSLLLTGRLKRNLLRPAPPSIVSK